MNRQEQVGTKKLGHLLDGKETEMITIKSKGKEKSEVRAGMDLCVLVS